MSNIMLISNTRETIIISHIKSFENLRYRDLIRDVNEQKFNQCIAIISILRI